MSRRITARILAALDRFVPPQLTVDAEDNRRARLLIATILLGTSILVASSLSSVVLGLDGRIALYNLAWAAAFLGLLALMRSPRSLDLVSNGVVAIAFLHLLILSSMSGGQNIGALFAFSILPMLSVLLAGWQSALVVTGLSALAILLTPLVPVHIMTPSHLAAAIIPAAVTRDALNVTFAVGLFSALYDAARSLSLRDARRARARAEKGELKLRELTDRQSHLLQVVRRFQDATHENFDEEIDHVMEAATKIAGADRTVIRIFVGRDWVSSYSWSSDGFEYTASTITVEETSRQFPWFANKMMSGEVTQVRDLDDLPEEAIAEKTFHAERGVVSWLGVPIRAGQRTIGYQRFECIRDHKEWSEAEVSAIGLMTEVLAAAVLRHRASIALRESETKFSIAFHDHPDAMIISDLETDVVLECNEQWLLEVAVAERDEVIGRKLWDFGFQFPDEQKEAMRRLLTDVGRTPAIETAIRGRLGDDRVYLVTATCIEIAGRPCVLATAHDLTERKQLEQQLLHAQKMEAIGRLAGGIAHDFNNMLTVISGYSGNLIHELEGEARRDAEEIHDAARRSAELTQQLLAFSRRQVLSAEILDPHELISGLEPMLRPLIGESIDLAIEVGEVSGLVRADRGQLEQAIVNLAVNARDAMPRGGHLTLTSTREEVGRGIRDGDWPPDLAARDYIVIRVCDDGEGMDPDLVAHVMEPFYTTKPEGKGTGLGLPMAHGVARQCGGALVLESELGRGTRAAIYLPVAEGVARSAPPIEAPPPRPSKPSTSKAHKILLVEDEPMLRRLTARMLKHAGHQVFEASNGREALECAAELGPDLDMVVSDVVMPHLSGIELYRKLRDERPELPILLMSGYPEPTGDGQPLPDDAEILPKPFRAEDLCAAVECGLESRDPESS